MEVHLFQPFQHQAIDSYHAIPCTKCHLSYYKFSAEYSADLMELRTKEGARQGHLGNASRESPASLGWMWGCFIATEVSMQYCHSSQYLKTDYCQHISLTTYAVFYFFLLEIFGLSNRKKCFASLSCINTLITFKQPWHSCAINVTDSLAGPSWLVLNHNCITVHMEDTSCSSLLWLPFVNAEHKLWKREHFFFVWFCFFKL